MKKLSMAVAMAFVSIAGSALAQDRASGIVESTDPAKISAIEEHARELQARRESMSQQATGDSGRASTEGKKHSGRSKAAKPHKSTGASSGTDAAGAGSSDSK